MKPIIRLSSSLLPFAESFPLSFPKRFIGTFRHNVCTDDWIAFPGPERAKRPRGMAEMGQFVKAVPPSFNVDCPFCEGNESLLPDPVLVLDSRDFLRPRRRGGMPTAIARAGAIGGSRYNKYNYYNFFSKNSDDDANNNGGAGGCSPSADCRTDSPTCPSNGSSNCDVSTPRYHQEVINDSHNINHLPPVSNNVDDTYTLKVVPNKYPVVSPTHCLIDPSTYPSTVLDDTSFLCSNIVTCLIKARALGLHQLPATGFHEVVVDHPRHRMTIAESDCVYWEMLFTAFRDRAVVLSQSPLIQTILAIKNVGFFGGASVSHPHSQLIALPVIPAQQSKLMECAEEYFRQNSSCLFCDHIDLETREQVRIIHESPSFLAIVPYAAHIPYHILILPKKHNHQFLSTSSADIYDLSLTLESVFLQLDRLLSNPDYNLVLRNSHFYRTGSHRSPFPHSFYHWHLEIFPRLASWPMGGFEFGSGILCNSHLPEDDAEALRTGVIKSKNVW